MLLPSRKKIFRVHLKYFFILSALGSLMTFTICLPLLFNSKSSYYTPNISPEKTEVIFYNRAGDYGIELLDWRVILVLIIGLLAFIESVFFWAPSLIEFTSDNGKGKMIWSKKRYGFIERVFCYDHNNIRIMIRRKRSSFRGLLMQEFNLEIYLPNEDTRAQKISSFTGIQKIIRTPRHNILVKDVDLKYLPLQFVQIQAILALS